MRCFVRIRSQSFQGEHLESLFVRAAGLNETDLNDPSAALGFWLKAFGLSGNDERYGPVVERIASDMSLVASGRSLGRFRR